MTFWNGIGFYAALSLAFLAGFILCALFRVGKPSEDEALGRKGFTPMTPFEPPKPEPRPEEIAAARAIIAADGNCTGIDCGDCPARTAKGCPIGGVEVDSPSPTAVHIARSWLASHGLSVEVADTEPGSLERAR